MWALRSVTQQMSKPYGGKIVSTRSQHHRYITSSSSAAQRALFCFYHWNTETRILPIYLVVLIFIHFFLPPRASSTQTAATMTELLVKKQHKSSNGNVLPEATREDVFDHSYKEKEGPKPPSIIVWTNVVLMTLLHIGAAYGVSVIPSASPLTLLWCK